MHPALFVIFYFLILRLAPLDVLNAFDIITNSPKPQNETCQHSAVVEGPWCYSQLPHVLPWSGAYYRVLVGLKGHDNSVYRVPHLYNMTWGFSSPQNDWKNLSSTCDKLRRDAAEVQRMQRSLKHGAFLSAERAAALRTLGEKQAELEELKVIFARMFPPEEANAKALQLLNVSVPCLCWHPTSFVAKFLGRCHQDIAPDPGVRLVIGIALSGVALFWQIRLWVREPSTQFSLSWAFVICIGFSVCSIAFDLWFYFIIILVSSLLLRYSTISASIQIGERVCAYIFVGNDNTLHKMVCWIVTIVTLITRVVVPVTIIMACFGYHLFVGHRLEEIISEIDLSLPDGVGWVPLYFLLIVIYGST